MSKYFVVKYLKPASRRSTVKDHPIQLIIGYPCYDPIMTLKQAERMKEQLDKAIKKAKKKG